MYSLGGNITGAILAGRRDKKMKNIRNVCLIVLTWLAMMPIGIGLFILGYLAESTSVYLSFLCYLSPGFLGIFLPGREGWPHFSRKGLAWILIIYLTLAGVLTLYLKLSD